MTHHRFFVPREAIRGDTVTFPSATAHQIRRVLRLSPTDQVTVFDGSGDEWKVRLETVDAEVTASIEEKRQSDAEPRLGVTLYVGLLKASKLELVLQRCTEVGVTRFVPTVTARSISSDVSTSRQHRWEAIIREAAEQSGRGRLPALEGPIHFADALVDASQGGLVLVPWEEERHEMLWSIRADQPAAIGLFIGPEGGFEAGEIALAREMGAQIVSLGPRILRSETASIVASALVLSHFDGARRD